MVPSAGAAERATTETGAVWFPAGAVAAADPGLVTAGVVQAPVAISSTPASTKSRSLDGVTDAGVRACIHVGSFTA
jgi:hypothetical protein